MLTDRCKEWLYPTLKNFKINYIDNIFEGKEKVYSFENWYKNTYYVTITESSLSTGKILAEKEAKHDYITIDNQKKFVEQVVSTINTGTFESIEEIFSNFKNDLNAYHFTRFAILNKEGNGITSDNIKIKD